MEEELSHIEEVLSHIEEVLTRMDTAMSNMDTATSNMKIAIVTLMGAIIGAFISEFGRCRSENKETRRLQIAAMTDFLSQLHRAEADWQQTVQQHEGSVRRWREYPNTNYSTDDANSVIKAHELYQKELDVALDTLQFQITDAALTGLVEDVNQAEATYKGRVEVLNNVNWIPVRKPPRFEARDFSEYSEYWADTSAIAADVEQAENPQVQKAAAKWNTAQTAAVEKGKPQLDAVKLHLPSLAATSTECDADLLSGCTAGGPSGQMASDDMDAVLRHNREIDEVNRGNADKFAAEIAEVNKAADEWYGAKQDEFAGHVECLLTSPADKELAGPKETLVTKARTTLVKEKLPWWRRLCRCVGGWFLAKPQTGQLENKQGESGSSDCDAGDPARGSGEAGREQAATVGTTDTTESEQARPESD